MKYRTQIYRRLGTGGAGSRRRGDVDIGGLRQQRRQALRRNRRSTTRSRPSGRSRASTCASRSGSPPAQLQQMAAPAGGTDELTPDGRQRHRRRPRSSIDLNTGNGKAAQRQPGSQATAATVRPGRPGQARPDPVKLRYVDQTFYLRADCRQPADRSRPGPVQGRRLPAGPAGRRQLRPRAGCPRPGQLGVGTVLGPRHPAAGPAVQAASVVGLAAAPTPAMPQQMLHQLHQAFTVQRHLHQGRHPGGSHPLHGLVGGHAPSSRSVRQSLPASLGSVPGASSLGKHINSGHQQDPRQPEGSSSMSG